MRVNKGILFFIVLIISFFLSYSNTEGGTKKIAVLDFDDSPVYGYGKIGRSVADLLISEIVKDGTFKVIERTQLEKILSEQKLSVSGLVDPSQAAKIGKILGVDAVVIGRVTHYGVEQKNVGILGVGVKTLIAKVTLNARLIDTTTAEVISAADATGEESEHGVRVGDIIQTGAGATEKSQLERATKKAVASLLKQFKEHLEKIK